MVAAGKGIGARLLARRMITWFTAWLSAGKVGTGGNTFLVAVERRAWLVTQVITGPVRAAEQTLPGAAIRHSNAGHSAKMSAHTIHLDIVYARPVDASGEAVLTLPRTLVAAHQDHTALFIALACFGFTTNPGMSVATLALILYFLLAQMLLWASILKTSYLVLMTLRTSHLYFNSTHCGADLATSVLTLMTTREVFAGSAQNKATYVQEKCYVEHCPSCGTQ